MVVTVNHRLNAFGYTYLGDAGPAFADSGNAGNLDLVASLEWVKANKLMWETPIAGGIFRSPHTLEMPLMFANAADSVALVGTGEAPMKMEAMMSDAWLAFAKTGTPASPLLPKWPAYTAKGREVMEFELEPKVVSDPERGLREATAGK